MKNICEWSNCKEVGKYKAPIEKDNIKNFRWLCVEHIKMFNKKWNYFGIRFTSYIKRWVITDA